MRLATLHRPAGVVFAFLFATAAMIAAILLLQAWGVYRETRKAERELERVQLDQAVQTGNSDKIQIILEREAQAMEDTAVDEAPVAHPRVAPIDPVADRIVRLFGDDSEALRGMLTIPESATDEELRRLVDGVYPECREWDAALRAWRDDHAQLPRLEEASSALFEKCKTVADAIWPGREEPLRNRWTKGRNP